MVGYLAYQVPLLGLMEEVISGQFFLDDDAHLF